MLEKAPGRRHTLGAIPRRVTLFGPPSSIIRNVREGPTGRAVRPEASGRIAEVGSCGARDGVFYVKSQGNLPPTDTMKTRFGLEAP